MILVFFIMVKKLGKIPEEPMPIIFFLLKHTQGSSVEQPNPQLNRLVIFVFLQQTKRVLIVGNCTLTYSLSRRGWPSAA